MDYSSWCENSWIIAFGVKIFFAVVFGALTSGFTAMFLFGSAACVVMDGLMTLIASSVHKKFVPHGQVAAWAAVFRG